MPTFHALTHANGSHRLHGLTAPDAEAAKRAVQSRAPGAGVVHLHEPTIDEFDSGIWLAKGRDKSGATIARLVYGDSPKMVSARAKAVFSFVSFDAIDPIGFELTTARPHPIATSSAPAPAPGGHDQLGAPMTRADALDITAKLNSIEGVLVTNPLLQRPIDTIGKGVLIGGIVLGVINFIALVAIFGGND